MLRTALALKNKHHRVNIMGFIGSQLILMLILKNSRRGFQERYPSCVSA